MDVSEELHKQLSVEGQLALKSLEKLYKCDLFDDEFAGNLFYDKEIDSLRIRNEQMAKRIDELLREKPNTKFLFTIEFSEFLKMF